MILSTMLIVAPTAFFAIFMPKKVALWELLVASIFVYMLDLFIIQICEIKYEVFVYVYKGIQWSGIIIEAIIYPAVNSIYVNFYPYNKGLKQKIIYILIASVAFTFGEYLFLKTGFLKYYHWNLIYSALMYPFMCVILILNQIMFRKLVYKETVSK